MGEYERYLNAVKRMSKTYPEVSPKDELDMLDAKEKLYEMWKADHSSVPDLYLKRQFLEWSLIEDGMEFGIEYIHIA